MITTEGKPVKQVTTEIAQKLIAQGFRCVNENGNCVHHDGEGNHCAIGWLLPKRVSHRNGIGGLVRSGVHMGENHNFIIDNYDLLIGLQLVHDFGSSSDRAIEIKSVSDRNAGTIDAEAWQPWVEMGAS